MRELESGKQKNRKEDLEWVVAAWEEVRNERGAQIKWQFTTADARIKLRRLYPML